MPLCGSGRTLIRFYVIIFRHVRLPGQHNARPRAAGGAHWKIRVPAVRPAGGSQRQDWVPVPQTLPAGWTFRINVRQRNMESVRAACLPAETPSTPLLPLSDEPLFLRTTSSRVRLPVPSNRHCLSQDDFQGGRKPNSQNFLGEFS